MYSVVVLDPAIYRYKITYKYSKNLSLFDVLYYDLVISSCVADGTIRKSGKLIDIVFVYGLECWQKKRFSVAE